MLDRYVLREAIGPFFFGLTAFTSLLVVNVLFSALEMLNNGMASGIVAKWMALNLPEIIVMTLPMASLLGTLLTFGRLSSNSEVTAMRAGGLSLWRIMVPIIVGSAFLSGFGILLNDRVVAPARLEADRLVLGAPLDVLRNTVRDNFYYPIFENGKPKMVWVASRFDGGSGTLDNASLFEFGDSGLSRVIYAKKAVWNGHVWKFLSGYVQQMGSEDTYQAEFSQYTVINAPPPAQMAIPDNSKTANMTLKQHRDFIKLLTSRGADTKLARLEYHHKLAIPIACLIFAFVGVPFGLQPNRSGSSVGLGLSIVLIFGYYVILIVTKSLGQSGSMSPELAAWTPDVLFGVVGIVLANKKAH